MLNSKHLLNIYFLGILLRAFLYCLIYLSPQSGKMVSLFPPFNRLKTVLQIASKLFKVTEVVRRGDCKPTFPWFALHPCESITVSFQVLSFSQLTLLWAQTNRLLLVLMKRKIYENLFILL